MQIPTYLHQNSFDIYYFRCRVPKILQEKYGKTVIKRSLNTRSQSRALVLARRMAADLQQEAEAQQEHPMKIINGRPVTELILNFPDGGSIEIDPNNVDGEFEILKRLGIEKETIAAIQEHLKLENGKKSKPKIVPTKPTITLSTIIEEYTKDRTDQGINIKTLSSLQSKCETILEIIGDVPVSEIGGKTVTDMMASIRNLPKNRKKMPAYRDKSILQLSKMKIPADDLISSETVKKYRNTADQLFAFAVQTQRIATNPMQLLPREKSSSKNTGRLDRDIFEDTEVLKILSHVQQFKTNKPAKFWLPYLAAYTGARLEELCQLTTTDIIEKDSIYCMQITEFAANHSVKTNAGNRLVPIHNKLIQHGFLKYVAQQHNKIFPELKPDTYGKLGASYSKSFTRMRRKLDITRPNVCFHSFRHSVITKLHHKGVNIDKIANIVGHEYQKFTSKVYSKRFPLTDLADVVKQIQYGGSNKAIKNRTTIF